MWEFIIPALISTVSGAIQSGSAARQTQLANQRTATAAQERRQMLMGLIDQIQNTDYGSLDRAASANFSRAADQIEALTAGRGTFGSGETGARNLQTQALSDVLIALEGQKGAQDLQRQQLVGQLMGDEAFGVPNPLLFNPNQAGMQAALSGGAAGLAQAAGAFFGTQAGQDWLKGLGGGGEAASLGEPMPQFGVRAAGASGAPAGVRPLASGPFTANSSGVRVNTGVGAPLPPYMMYQTTPAAPAPIPGQFHYQPVLSYAQPMPSPWQWGQPRLVP